MTGREIKDFHGWYLGMMGREFSHSIPGFADIDHYFRQFPHTAQAVLFVPAFPNPSPKEIDAYRITPDRPKKYIVHEPSWVFASFYHSIDTKDDTYAGGVPKVVVVLPGHFHQAQHFLQERYGRIKHLRH